MSHSGEGVRAFNWASRRWNVYPDIWASALRSRADGQVTSTSIIFPFSLCQDAPGEVSPIAQWASWPSSVNLVRHRILVAAHLVSTMMRAWVCNPLPFRPGWVISEGSRYISLLRQKGDEYVTLP